MPAAPPTLPPPPPSLLYRRRIGSRRSQGTLSSALLPCAPPAWLASCCCVQWGVAEEACGVEGQLPKGVKVVSSVDCTQCCLHERNVSGTALKHEERHS